MFPSTSMPDREWWAALWPHPEETLRALGIEPRMTVLDLCCGDGYFTAPLAKLVQGKVIALDLDCEMLALAKAEVARQGASVRQWVCADAMALDEHVAEPVGLRADGQHVPRCAGPNRTRKGGPFRAPAAGSVRHRQLVSVKA